MNDHGVRRRPDRGAACALAVLAAGLVLGAVTLTRDLTDWRETVSRASIYGVMAGDGPAAEWAYRVELQIAWCLRVFLLVAVAALLVPVLRRSWTAVVLAAVAAAGAFVVVCGAGRGVVVDETYPMWAMWTGDLGAALTLVGVTWFAVLLVARVGERRRQPGRTGS